MNRHSEMEADMDIIIVEETREQAARSISSALEFLRHEAAAIGMLDVSELIRRASDKANEYWPAPRKQ
jgi:hypothetical protein